MMHACKYMKYGISTYYMYSVYTPYSTWKIDKRREGYEAEFID